MTATAERHYPHPSLDAPDQPTALAANVQSSGGMLVTVTGLPGVGKSTWARQFVAAAGRHKVVAVTADAFEKDFAFGLVDKLAHAAGEPLGILGETGTPDPLTVAQRLLPALAHGTSARRRLVVLVDNAHWIDDASLAVLRFVLSRLAHGGVCTVFSGLAPRTQEVSAHILDADETAWDVIRRIQIEPLEASHVRGYVSNVHDREISLRLAQRIRDQSGGIPVLIDALIPSLQQSGMGNTHWDEGIVLHSSADNPFQQVGKGESPSLAATVEIVSVLHDAVSRIELATVAERLGETIDVDGALAAGVLVQAGEGAVAPFHDLYSSHVVAGLHEDRRRRIQHAAAAVLENPHRAFLLRLDAATTLSGSLLTELHEMVELAVKDGDAERAIGYLRTASTRANSAQRDDLIVEACLLAAANLISPTVIDLIPDLERMRTSPVRDLALLQTRQITGDIQWARSFAAHLMDADRPGVDRHPDHLLLQMHVSMMSVMIQLTTDDYTPIIGMLERTRTLATELQSGPGDVSDRRLLPLFTAEEVLLRCIGLTIVAAARLGDHQRVTTALHDLSAAISTAQESPALIDALTCRAGVLAGVGAVTEATIDLESALTIASHGVAGWSLGHARALLAYCYWVLGRPTDATSLLDTASLVALDNIDVSSRPLLYLMRAIIAADSGDLDAHTHALRTAKDVTVTDYDTFGVELELLAAVQRARTIGSPQEVLDALSDERLSGRWLAGSSIFTYKVDALASLGRAEEADRELSRLRALAGQRWTPIYGSLEWLEGRVAEAYELTEDALKAYRRASRTPSLPAPHAQALYDLGRYLIETRHEANGRRALRSALAAFRRLAAIPAIVRTLTLLDGSVDSSSQAGPLDGLTSREREVAANAANGLTNAEIAKLLYLSIPTVSFHMRNVLAKLGLSSRRELRSLLQPESWTPST